MRGSHLTLQTPDIYLFLKHPLLWVEPELLPKVEREQTLGSRSISSRGLDFLMWWRVSAGLGLLPALQLGTWTVQFSPVDDRVRVLTTNWLFRTPICRRPGFVTGTKIFNTKTET